MNNFIYDIPVKVYFGKDQIIEKQSENSLTNLGAELSRFGKRVLLTYGGGSIKKIGLYDKVLKAVKEAGLELYELSGIAPNPRIQSVRDGAKICKEKNIDVILAVGGGSTLDCSKFIAAAAFVDFDPWKFFSEWAPIEKALPLVTVLTLSATGSEMDTGGVLSNPDTNDKLGRLDFKLLPKVSFLDPCNTFTVSEYQTACGSADIFSHICEVYFDKGKDFYMLDTFMEGMLRTVIKYTPVAMGEPTNYEARANLMWTSSWAINGFINGGAEKAWSCHPMEHELSAFYDITHGLGLAILTPRWMEYCLNKDKGTLERFYRFGHEVFGIDPEYKMSKEEVAKEAIEATKKFLFNTLKLKSTLGEIGIGPDKFSIMAKKAVGGSTLKGFVELTAEDVKNIFRMCA